jgi:hypothetical protein
MPKNPTLVVSADQQSAVVEIRPGAFFCLVSGMNMMNSKLHLQIYLPLTEPTALRTRFLDERTLHAYWVSP